MKVYLSPSNQCANTYAYSDTNEMEQCNRIAEAAEAALIRNGYEVKRAPKGQDMYETIKESNEWGADLHIPIHTNAGGGAGTVVFVYSKNAENMRYANPIYHEVQNASPGDIDYNVRVMPQLAELNGTKATAVYVECEFHDNAEYAKWIIDNTKALGEAICRGVCEADGKEYNAPEKPVGTKFYRVQVGAFNDYNNAVNMRNELESKGYPTVIVEVKR